MAYDEETAARVREVLDGRAGISERKMFGGLAFMLNGNMCCCVDKDNLIVRVGRERYEESLSRPGAGVFDMTGRPMRGFVYVSRPGFASPADLREWLGLAVAFTGSLPAKGG